MNENTNSGTPQPKNFVLLPGAWSGPWSWEPIRTRLTRRGHRVHAVGFSGLHPHGDVSSVDLQTHVNDALTTMARHELTDVVLVGHSYSGLVAGLVTDQAPHRIAHTVYVQGFLAQHGQSLLDAFPAEQKAKEIADIEAHDGWWPPPSAEAIAEEPDLSPDQIRWLARRLVPHPGRTVTEPVELSHAVADQASTYISSARATTEIETMTDQQRWNFHYIEAGHWPMLTIPDQLTEILVQTAMSQADP